MLVPPAEKNKVVKEKVKQQNYYDKTLYNSSGVIFGFVVGIVIKDIIGESEIVHGLLLSVAHKNVTGCL
ncbi:MAG: hypothetical protein WC845_01190 [Candidatus Staskawiczbacteria bacterium]|jgi:hypothetical protein